MKKFVFVAFLLLLAPGAFAQDQTIFITGFEDTEDLIGDWTWTGNSITEAFVDYPPDPKPVQGEAAFHMFYDNAGSEWQYTTFNFAINPLDLTGMREIHMSVYFMPESTGTIQIRLDLPNGSIMDVLDVPAMGEWVEMVWKIDRLTSSTRISSVNYFNGFIVPTPGTAAGELYIDNIYAVRPESVSDVEEKLIYGFNEKDPNTDGPIGWEASSTYPPEMMGDIATPSEGTDAMVMFAVPGGGNVLQTNNAKSIFNQWADVKEVLFDIQILESVPGGWIQSRIHMRSGIGDDEATVVDVGTREIGYTDAVGVWKTLLYEVDMTNHLANIQDPNGWVQIRIDTNCDASADGFPIYIDNLRVSVPKGSTDVADWSVF